MRNGSSTHNVAQRSSIASYSPRPIITLSEASLVFASHSLLPTTRYNLMCDLSITTGNCAKKRRMTFPFIDRKVDSLPDSIFCFSHVHHKCSKNSLFAVLLLSGDRAKKRQRVILGVDARLFLYFSSPSLPVCTLRGKSHYRLNVKIQLPLFSHYFFISLSLSTLFFLPNNGPCFCIFFSSCTSLLIWISSGVDFPEAKACQRSYLFASFTLIT